MAQVAAKQTTIPIAIHLDHHEDFDAIKTSIDLGFRSAMIDASRDPYDENVARVKEVVDYAHHRDATVERNLANSSARKTTSRSVKPTALIPIPTRQLILLKRRASTP